MAIDALSIIIGFVAGLLVMGLVVWLTMPSLMLIKHKCKHSYAETLTTLGEYLQKKQDWRLLRINDYQESTAPFRAIEQACSISVCNPRYASNILADDANRGVTAFMPLAVGIYENRKGETIVSRLNVGLLGMMFGGTIAQVMKKAGADLKDVVSSAIAR